MFNLSLIGPRIKELRKKKKLSQEELAEIIDVNFRTIQRIETSVNIPSLETLSKLTEALDVDIQDFFKTEHLVNRDEILSNINDIAKKLNDSELKNFYKAIHLFYK